MTDLKADQGKPDFTLLPPEVFVQYLNPLVRPVYTQALAGEFMLAQRTLAQLFHSKEAFLIECVKVCDYGNKKYAVDNWRANLGTEGFRPRYTAALGRHLLKHCLGECADLESRLPHLAHAGVNLMFLECNRLATRAGEAG